MQDVEKLFKPTLPNWIGLIPQMWYSRNKKYDAEFLEKYQRMKEIRDDLRALEKSLQNFHRSIKITAENAKKVGNLVQTKPEVLSEVEYQVDLLLKDKSPLERIHEKIEMIESLIAMKSTLKFIRLRGDHAERKLQQLKKKEAHEQFETQSDLYLKIKKEAYKRHEGIMKEIFVVANEVVDQTQQNGVIDIVKSQIDTFKLNVKQLLQKLYELLAGPNDEGEDLRSFVGSFQGGPSFQGSFADFNTAKLREEAADYHDPDFESDADDDDDDDDDGAADDQDDDDIDTLDMEVEVEMEGDDDDDDKDVKINVDKDI